MESRTGRRAGGLNCTVVGCKEAAGGQGPAEGSPAGQPACLRRKRKEIQKWVMKYSHLCRETPTFLSQSSQRFHVLLGKIRDSMFLLLLLYISCLLITM